MEDKFEAFEEDFEEQVPNYVIWVFSYTANDMIIGDYFVADFGPDAEAAAAHAEKLVSDPEALKQYALKDAAYVQVTVETVVEVDGWTTNAGNIFDEFVKL